MFFVNGAAPKAPAFKSFIMLICMVFSLSACDNFNLLERNDEDSVTEPRTPTEPAVSSVVTPTFSPAPGAISSGTRITISTLTSGATIHYTLDGSAPTINSPEYTAPVALPDGTVDVRAFAVESGLEDSSVAAGTYTVGDDGSLDPYQEVDGTVQFPAEGFHNRLPDPNGLQWEVMTQAGAFGGEMIRSPNITDDNTVQNIIQDPFTHSTRVDYKINFTTPGTYFVSLRWFGDRGNGNVYIGLDEQKIPSSNPNQDHFRFTDVDDVFAWDPAKNGPYTIEVSTAGEHTFHLWMRQSALKLDHVFLSLDQNAEPPQVDPVDPDNNTVATPDITPVNGSSVNIGDIVTVTTSPTNATIYYTTDGSNPTSASSPYSGGIAVVDPDDDGMFQVKAIALLDGYVDSAIASASYTITTPVEPGVVEDPVFDPAGGTFSAGAQVHITSATNGAIIYYTTNGSEPDASATRYESPITLTNGDTVIKAIALKDGSTDSGITSANFTVTDSMEGRLFKEADGLVVMEAEHYSQSAPAAYKSYDEDTDTFTACTVHCDWSESTPPGAVAGIAMAVPRNGYVYSPALQPDFDYETLNARLDYRIEFTTPGTYYLWLRGQTGDNRTVFVGLNGDADSTAFRFHPTTSSWDWDNARPRPFEIYVPAAGIHTFNLWMRNAGPVIDRILLTTSAELVPTGDGPAESDSTGGLTANTAPMISPDGGAFGGGTTVSITASAGSTIYYTTDGTVPTTSSQVYQDPFTVSTTSEIWAIAKRGGFRDSPITKVRFQIEATPETVFLESNGQVVIEAENFLRSIADPLGNTWDVNFQSGATDSTNPDGNAVQAPLGVDPTAGSFPYTTNQAQLQYVIDFTRTGTYYLWVRSYAPTVDGDASRGSHDSVRIALDGNIIRDDPTYDEYLRNATLPGSDWFWANRMFTNNPPPDSSGAGIANVPFRIEIDSTGAHTISLVVRETAYIADRIVLSVDAAFNPDSTPPGAESPTSVGSPAP